MKTIVSLLLFMLSIQGLEAQVFGQPPEGEGKAWNIRFVIDPGFVTWKANYRDIYEGERYLGGPDSTGSSWTWASWDSVDNRVLDFYKVGTLRLGVLLNIVEDMYVGINYSGYLIQGYKRTSGQFLEYIYWPFYSLSGSVNYDYRLPILQERFSLQPTLSAGTYQSDRSFEGIGQELSYEARLGLAYQFRKEGKSQIRLWANYQRMTYRASEPSLVYPGMQRKIATNWDLFSVGAGLVWHLEIQEDYDPAASARQQRRDRRKNKLEKKQERLERKLGGQ